MRASCEWAFLSVQLLALRCQVKGQPEDGSERKPFLFSWKQPSGPAQGSLLFCPRGFFIRRAFPGFFPLPLGTSCPASPCVLLWSLAKKAQHKQKSDQGATEQGSLECEAASAGPKANRGIFWPHTVRRCVCSPASPVQPRISISLEVASQSPSFLPAYAAVKRFPTLLGRVGMQVFIGKNVIWCLLFNFSSHCQHLQVSLFILCCCPPG